ncbi:hypothetical protein Tco_0842417 [Tanacetum coccineum]|uniref:Reverse transcriptase Ty1/copia-type domain-containing protein n=1 Tax=Tanacetum coccineum TaxID=301880 RepID=A0ABQ5AZ75_9ASTR
MKTTSLITSQMEDTSAHDPIQIPFNKRGTWHCYHRIKQSERGISINKERYVNDLLRKYDKIGSSVNTPIMPPNMLGHDLNGKAANESQYRGMIGSLMNLTASRPDIQFSTDLYA